MQYLMNRTTYRIFKISKISQGIEIFMDTFEMIHKWGGDGSCGHSKYNVEFNISFSDSDFTIFYVFFFTITATWI